MSKVRKVYLPAWMTWLGVAFVLPTWSWVTYRVFFSGASEDLGAGGWLLTTVFMAGMVVVLYLMGRRKLPAYVIEIEDDEESGSRAAGPDEP